MEKAIKTGMANYRDKLEKNLTTNKSKNIWQGLKFFFNYKQSSINTDIADSTLIDNLNDFHCWCVVYSPITRKQVAIRYQVPLRLAFAMKIHKCQGKYIS